MSRDTVSVYNIADLSVREVPDNFKNHHYQRSGFLSFYIISSIRIALRTAQHGVGQIVIDELFSNRIPF